MRKNGWCDIFEVNGYRPISSWWANCVHSDKSHNGRFRLCGNAILDIAPSARLNLFDDLIIGANLRKGSRAETYLKMQDSSSLTVNGRYQVFFGGSLELFEGGNLTLGRGYINTGAAIACTRSVTIGDGVFIARNVYITDSDHHKFLTRSGLIQNEPEPIVIGDHVLVGFGAVILKGVSIGDGAVIAAGAVVTRDIPPGCLAAGVPAKVVKEEIVWK